MKHSIQPEPAAGDHGALEHAMSERLERHGYAAPAGRRRVATIGMCALYTGGLAGALFSVRQTAPVEVESAPIVVTLIALASPPEVPPADREAPKPTIERVRRPIPVPPLDRTLVPHAPVSAPVPSAPSAPAPPDPRPSEPEDAAPKTLPAPPASQAASNAPDSWEGRVLAALHKERRYPRPAMIRRQQGMPYIRFVMDRGGRVLSSRIERSSGYAELDREAVALVRRASPLPKPPADKSGETLELVVPVEFFLR